MRGKLAVSDSRLELVAALALPNLDVETKVRMPFRPGKLASGSMLYVADADGPLVHALHPKQLSEHKCFATGPEIEALALSESGMHLYVLSGGANSLQMVDVGQGRLINVARTGMRPRGFALDTSGKYIAVACGDTYDILLLEAATLRTLSTFQAGGVTIAVRFFAGQLMALCATGEYDMGTLVGAVGSNGKWCPWAALPGMPGAIAPCGGGLLVGHHVCLTMLDPPNGRIRWQTKISGLPTEIIPIGRIACYADGLDGMIGLIDLRKGTVLRRLRVEEPVGLCEV